jgi:hypothetical protein
MEWSDRHYDGRSFWSRSARRSAVRPGAQFHSGPSASLNQMLSKREERVMGRDVA